MDIILIEMQRRGWNTMNLSKESGVVQPVISRFLNGSINIKVKNIFNLLKSLGLVSTTGKEADPPGCPVQCDKDLRELCKKVKSVIDSGSDYADALKSNIVCFEKSVQLERRIDNLEKLSSPGQRGGAARAARLTAKKQTAG